MRCLAVIVIALVTLVLARAAQPRLVSLQVTLDPYVVQAGGSNAVIVLYKSTSLGTVWTPFKPTAIFPATRATTTVAVLPGLYRFYCTARVDPFGEAEPSNVCTNTVVP